MSDIASQAKLLGLYPLVINQNSITATLNTHHYFNKLSDEDNETILNFCSQYGIIINIVNIKGVFDGPFLVYDSNIFPSKMKINTALYQINGYLMVPGNLESNDYIEQKWEHNFIKYHILNMNKMIRSYHPVRMLSYVMPILTNRCLKQCHTIKIDYVSEPNKITLPEQSLNFFDRFVPKVNHDEILKALKNTNVDTIIIPKIFNMTPRINLKTKLMENIHWTDTDPKELNFLPINIKLIFH